MWTQYLLFVTLLLLATTNQGKPLDCSEYIDTTDLGSDTYFRYVSTETHISIEITSPRKAWIGFAVSKYGAMYKSDAVIGTVDEVARYKLEAASATRLASEEQTLTNATFLQDENGSTLRFTKRLVEEGTNLSIVPDGKNIFIWCLGNDNYITPHGRYGVLSATLSPCIEGSNNTNTTNSEVVIPSIAKSNRNLFVIHGWLAIVAFGMFMPFSIAASGARNLPLLSKEVGNKKGTKKVWFLLHSLGNSAAYILTVVLFAIAVYAFQRKNRLHFRDSAHEVVGLITVVLMTAQILLGVLRPGTGSEEMWWCHATVRAVWWCAHVLLGVGTFACGLYQLHSGLVLFEERYLGGDYIAALWISLSCLIGVLVGVVVYSKRL